MSLSIRVNSPFMSLSFSRYVRFIFHVCPFLSLPVISVRLSWFPLVSLSFVCLAVPPHCPCLYFFPFHVHFSSPSFPFHFPLLSCHVNCASPACPCISLSFLPSFPCASLHCPFAPRYFSGKKWFYPRSRTKMSKTQIFADFRQRQAENLNQQRAGRGIRAWNPCFATPAPQRLFLVEHH